MRKLIVFALVAATLYGGYWFVGRSQIQTQLTLALEDADAGAYDVGYGSLKTRGFPSRFDTTITEFEFTDPATAPIGLPRFSNCSPCPIAPMR